MVGWATEWVQLTADPGGAGPSVSAKGHYDKFAVTDPLGLRSGTRLSLYTDLHRVSLLVFESARRKGQTG